MNCGECTGLTTVGKGKSKMTCPICKGTGEGAEAYDASDTLITPGELARIVPRQIGVKDNGEIIYSDGYKGRVRYVTRTPKDLVAVSIIALPELSGAGQKTFNHGHRAARPENIRMLKSNANQKRLKRHKDKLNAKKSSSESGP